MRDGRKANIEDVARVAGVSVATVSRVINGMSNVKDSTKDKVMAAMDELAYAPNAVARSLRTKESNAVLVLTPNFTNPFYSHILAGIGERAKELNYSALIVPFELEKHTDRILKSLLDSQKADGAILLGASINDDWLVKYEKEYNLVQCLEFSEKTTNIPHISIDNYQAMYDITKYIMSLGHERLGIVINDNNFISTNLRKKAFFDAINEENVRYDVQEYICAGKDYSFEAGVEAAKVLLSKKERPTAILCISDIMALGVVSGANDLGIRVPEDLSVTGFDDVDYTKMFHPYLTTVKQPCYDLGKKSIELLNKILLKESFDKENYLPYEIKVRESTKQLI